MENWPRLNAFRPPAGKSVFRPGPLVTGMPCVIPAAWLVFTSSAPIFMPTFRPLGLLGPPKGRRFCRPSSMIPRRAPRFFAKASLASTMRASIMTWRTATSMRAIRRRISSRRLGTSCTNSVLVRASTTALPRLDRMRCAASDRSFCTSTAFW
jgi:hypothetical protein